MTGVQTCALPIFIPAAAGGLARVISPNASRNPNLQLLSDVGVKPTFGQTLGGFANRLEEKAQSLPIMGDAITAARRRGVQQFNQAAIDRATSPIGAKVDGIGHQGVADAGDAISRFYDQALTKVQHVPLDNQFAGSLQQLQGMAQNLTPDMARKFDKTLNEIGRAHV